MFLATRNGSARFGGVHRVFFQWNHTSANHRAYNKKLHWKRRCVDVNVKIGSSRPYISVTTLSILAHEYVLRFNLYFNVYHIRSYIFTACVTSVWHVLPDDGHKRCPKHVGVTILTYTRAKQWRYIISNSCNRSKCQSSIFYMHVVYHVLLYYQSDDDSFTKPKQVSVGYKNILYILQISIGFYESNKRDEYGKAIQCQLNGPTGRTRSKAAAHSNITTNTTKHHPLSPFSY